MRLRRVGVVLRTGAALAGAAALLVAGTGVGIGGAVTPPNVPPGPPPADPPPDPDQPMRQIRGCTLTGVMPGSDLRELPSPLALMDMPAVWQESTGAGVVVAVTIANANASSGTVASSTPRPGL